MRIITEIELRGSWKQKPFTCYSLSGGARLTPAARQFLTDQRIDIIQDAAESKPEDMCHLFGKELVPKHHPRIRLRGMVDSFYGFMVEIELLAAEKKMPKLQQELGVLRKYAGQLIQAEATGKELPFIDFYGWSAAEIRKQSHHPKKYYGIDHFRAHPSHGIIMARLNTMRTTVRELEVAACEVFGKEKGNNCRQDILMGLNRFSSIAYILMCRLRVGVYENEKQHQIG